MTSAHNSWTSGTGSPFTFLSSGPANSKNSLTWPGQLRTALSSSHSPGPRHEPHRQNRRGTGRTAPGRCQEDMASRVRLAASAPAGAQPCRSGWQLYTEDIFMDENFFFSITFSHSENLVICSRMVSDRNSLSRHTCNFSVERNRRSVNGDLAGNYDKWSKTAQTSACKTHTQKGAFFYPCFLKVKLHC